MDLSVSSLMVDVIFGSLGLGYFIYGKKEQLLMPLVIGLALMVYPYFVADLWANIGIGVVLAILPFVFRF
jgi:hypothetical protein